MRRWTLRISYCTIIFYKRASLSSLSYIRSKMVKSYGYRSLERTGFKKGFPGPIIASFWRYPALIHHRIRRKSMPPPLSATTQGGPGITRKLWPTCINIVCQMSPSRTAFAWRGIPSAHYSLCSVTRNGVNHHDALGQVK